MKIILAILSIILIIFMAEITQNIYDYGFDKSLNKITPEQTLPLNEIEAVRNSLLQSGIDMNTVNEISTGNLNRDDFHWYTLFESIDSYNKALVGAGSISATYLSLTLTTGGTTNNSAIITKGIWSGNDITWGKQRKIRTKVYNTHNTAQTVYIVTGSANGGSDTLRHFGFKIVDGTIYGTNANGGIQNTVLLQTLSAGTEFDLEAKYYPAERVDFYINKILKGTSRLYLPAGVLQAENALEIGIVTTENSAKQISFGSWDFWQAN